jgi:hypothetical protein
VIQLIFEYPPWREVTTVMARVCLWLGSTKWQRKGIKGQSHVLFLYIGEGKSQREQTFNMINW